MTENNTEHFSIGGFSIDAKPSDDEDYNWIHTNCETIASAVAMKYSPPGEKVVAIFRMYRDHIQENTEPFDGPIDPDRFVAWLRDHTYDSSTVGEWEAEMFRGLDEMLAGAVETQEMDPTVAQGHFSVYVERTTEEMGLTEFFEVHE